MGVTATLVGVGIGAGIGGLLIGGGSVAYYKHRQRQKEIEDQLNYFRNLQDLRLQNKRVRAILRSSNEFY